VRQNDGLRNGGFWLIVALKARAISIAFLAILLSDAGGPNKELQNCLARSVELIGVSGGRTRGSGRKGDDGLLFMSWALVAPVANPSSERDSSRVKAIALGKRSGPRTGNCPICRAKNRAACAPGPLKINGFRLHLCF
jgi:hypothetical protein